jgi:hypothetical protein
MCSTHCYLASYADVKHLLSWDNPGPLFRA